MSIIKTTFVVALVAFLMPSPPQNTSQLAMKAQQQAGRQVDLVSAATDAAADVGSFCQRQREVCRTARYLMWKFEAKAKYGVRLVYEWANETPAAADMPKGYANQAVVVDPITTGSIRKVASNEPSAPSQNTLSLKDLIPAWHGPRSKKAS